MRTPDGSTLGQRLRTARLARRVSQASLARRAGVSVTVVVSIEHGQTLRPRMATVVALARVLDVAPSWLLSTDADVPDAP